MQSASIHYYVHLSNMMLCRQRTLFFATLVMCALFARQESGVMVSAEEKADKEDKEDDIMDPVEINVMDASAPPSDSPSIVLATELPTSDDNTTMIEDMDCTCDENIISCSDPSDEEACVCEDGDVVCEDTPIGSFMSPVAAPMDEPPAPDTEPVISGASSSSSMISIAISAAGIAAVALN